MAQVKNEKEQGLEQQALKEGIEQLEIRDSTSSNGTDGDSINKVQVRDEAGSISQDMEEVLGRTNALLQEMDLFDDALTEARVHKLVNLRAFRTQVQNEIKIIEKLGKQEDSKDRLAHKLSSSNLPYLETVWSAAKRSTGILQFRKWFYWGDSQKTDQQSEEEAQQAPQSRHPPSQRSSKYPSEKGAKHAVIVDIVSSNGRLWQKVVTHTNKKIIFEMAKLGWQNDSEDEDEGSSKENAGGSNSEDEDDEDELSILRTAKDLARAARANRCRNRRPEIHFILPRVQRGAYREIDTLLEKIAKTGAKVFCADDFPPTPSIATALPLMVIDQSQGLSQTLNIDCTILLALVSDISHASVTVQDWFPGFVKRQIQMEREVQLLPATLYPTMSRHPLVCTEEAADTMRHIVDTIGTDDEKARTYLLMGDDKTQTPKQLRQGLQKLSAYPVPDDWLLPIKVVDKRGTGSEQNNDNSQTTTTNTNTIGTPSDNQSTTASNIQKDWPSLPPVANLVAAKISDLNQSIFFYGWATGTTTLSSNGVVTKQIERIVAENSANTDITTTNVAAMTTNSSIGEEDQQRQHIFGPDIWTCREARSLIARKPRGIKDS